MQFLCKTLVVAFLPLVLAQYGGGNGGGTSSSSTPVVAPAASSASSSTPSVQTVAVGASGLTFSPDTITAAVGSMVEFIFSPPEHSVVQSSFASPCNPLANNTGFYSGPFTTTAGTNPNVFTITVNDTKPMWFFCGVPSHCGLGMAGVINPPSDGSSTLAQYIAAAANVTSPTTPLVVQGGTVGAANAVTSSSTSPVPSTNPTKSAGIRVVEAGGCAKWAVVALTGLFAFGFGCLII